jgi:hypothetical protein
MTDQRPQRVNKHTNTWPITGHDSISRQMHDRSQATTIQQSCYRSCICLLMESLWPVIGHVFACLLNRGQRAVMYLSASGIVAIQQAHKYMIDQSHNDSTSRQMHDRSQATTIQQTHKYMTDHRVLVESLWPVIGHVFVC